jgi:BMFP domain-containing protein YqiC
MLKQKIVDQLTSSLGGLLKASPLTDVESNLKALIHATFDKLDLVTREEFDTQQKVLLNTRAKLEELEQAIRELEKSANPKS